MNPKKIVGSIISACLFWGGIYEIWHYSNGHVAFGVFLMTFNIALGIVLAKQE